MKAIRMLQVVRLDDDVEGPRFWTVHVMSVDGVFVQIDTMVEYEATARVIADGLVRHGVRCRIVEVA